MEYETIIINLYGAPCAGKSTVAAQLFSLLKWNKIEVELINEYAKDLVWEERNKTLKNQIYIFAKQHKKIFNLLNKVKFIITDSPLLLCSFYNNKNNYNSKELDTLILSEYNKCKNIDILLNRTTTYNPNGRMETEEQVNQYHDDMIMFLNEKIGQNNYITMDSSKETAIKILEILLN